MVELGLKEQLSVAINFHQTGDLRRAKAIYEDILQVHPWHFDALHLLGLLAHQVGNPAAALALIDKAISIKPDNPGFLNHRGIVLHALGEYQKALDSYEQALGLRPEFADAYVNRGNAFESLLLYDQAVKSYDLAIQIDAKSLNAHLNKATILEKLGQSLSAVETCDEVLRFSQNSPQLHCTKGISLLTLGYFAEAINSFNAALALSPNFVPALCNRGIAFQRMYQYNRALGDMHQSIFLEPRNSGLYFNLGALYFDIGEIPKALENYNEALRLNPESVDPAFNKALLYLSQKEFETGWDLLHHRFIKFKLGQLQTSLPVWEPGSPEHRCVLIWGEQGVGDQILFISLLKEAQQCIPELHVMVDSRLIPLLMRSLSGICFHPLEEPIKQAQFDAQMPIMSLGGIFRRNQHDFLNATHPLLQVNLTLAGELKHSIVSEGEVLCGIFWRSGNNKEFYRKSLQLEDLLPILKIPGVKFLNLQYGDTDDECKLFQEKTGIQIDKCETIDNFKDLDGHAALIHACDFLVGCSNTSAHLAGALGKKTYMAVAYGNGAFWYWANEVDGRSLWYPSIEIHRQVGPGSWSVPIDSIRSNILGSLTGGPTS